MDSKRKDIIDLFGELTMWFIAGELHSGYNPERRAVAVQIIRDLADAMEANDPMKLSACQDAMIAFARAALATEFR